MNGFKFTSNLVPGTGSELRLHRRRLKTVGKELHRIASAVRVT